MSCPSGAKRSSIQAGNVFFLFLSFLLLIESKADSVGNDNPDPKPPSTSNFLLYLSVYSLKRGLRRRRVVNLGQWMEEQVHTVRDEEFSDERTP